MYRKRGDEEVTDNDLGKMIADHWKYVESVLIAHGVQGQELKSCGHHYRTAFKHGWKHAKEETGERLFTHRGEKEVYEFAEAMIETLNMPKNKVKGTWKDETNDKLFCAASDELDELNDAKRGNGDICAESVDLALSAMFLYDNNKKR